MKLDGITGQPYPAYTGGGFDIAVHTDGTIFAVQGTQGNSYSVVGIDPTTGTQKFSVPLPLPQPYNSGQFEDCPASTGDYFYAAHIATEFSGIIVAGDGNAYVPYSYEECNGLTLVAAHLRLLQISSSGASNALTILDAQAPPTNDYETTIASANMITNADTGVLLIWNLTFTGGEVEASTQYGMAITSGTSVSIVNPPAVAGQTDAVVPVLQAQDGSFVGWVQGPFVGSGWQMNMVSFDATGNVRWVVPNDQPQIATADGGVIGQSGTTYDQNGNVTGTSQAPGGVPDWSGQFYSVGSSGVQQLYSWVGYGAGFWSVAGSNPSGVSTSVVNVGLLEGLPLFLLPQKIPCTVGSVQSFLGGQASLNYTHFKPLLLAGLQAPTLPSSCSNLFNGQSGRPTLGAVISAVTNQVAYSGPASNLSMYAAGEWVSPTNCPSQVAPCLDQTLFNTFPGQFQNTAVCWGFLSHAGLYTVDVATAQVQPPATDAYYTTLPNEVGKITQSLILHEALHNLTGLGDPDLYKLLTGQKLPDGPTDIISNALVRMGCASN